jgi:hypothetical protein
MANSAMPSALVSDEKTAKNKNVAVPKAPARLRPAMPRRVLIIFLFIGSSFPGHKFQRKNGADSPNKNIEKPQIVLQPAFLAACPPQTLLALSCLGW